LQNGGVITIRTATSDEALAVLALWRWADAEPTNTDDEPSVRRLMEHDPGALIVAEDAGTLVGSVIAGWDGWRAGIYRLVVAPTHRRRGLARRLLDEAERQLDGRGARRLAAIVVESDARAMAFWRSSRWEEQADRVRFVRG
jgi:ribosomal protein S18 acetylase RimI-like enzyme